MTFVRSHKLPFLSFRLALFLLTTIAMTPVLLRPHWGMFSDPGQILDTCHSIFGHHATFSEMARLACGDFRPVFHLVNFAVWAIWPENPLPYFLLKWFCFALTVDLTFQIAYLLTDSEKTALICAIGWFLTYPTYEVIYTLDKGEIYLALLFAFVISAHLNAMRLSRQGTIATRNIFLGASVLLGCLALTFTKLPGNLVLAYAGLPLVTTIVRTLGNSDQKRRTIEIRLQDPVQNWRLFFFGACLLATISFIGFYVAGEGYKHPYGETSLSLPYLLSQLKSYSEGIPEFFACMLFTAAGFFLSRDRPESINNWRRQEAIMLALTSTLGAAALLTWKSQIAYSYYPLYSFLLPAFAYVVNGYWSRFKIVPVIISTIYAAILLPSRFVDAQEQFQMDALFANLAKLVASSSLPIKNSVIVPMTHQASAELGEELEFMTCHFAKKQPLHYELLTPEMVAQQTVTPPRISNVILGSSGDSKKDLSDLHEEFFLAKNFVESPGFYKLTYFRENNPNWLVENVLPGDILLIPYGDLHLSKIPFRGLSLFIKPESAKLGSYQYLEPKPIFRVEKSIHDLFGRVQKMGWLAVQFTKDCKYSLSLADYGWLQNPCTIYFAPFLHNRTISLQTELSCVSEISIRCQNQSIKIIASPIRPGLFCFDIPLIESGQKLESIGGQKSAPFLMKISSVSVAGKS